MVPYDQCEIARLSRDENVQDKTYDWICPVRKPHVKSERKRSADTGFYQYAAQVQLTDKFQHCRFNWMRGKF